jgi:hypothetical protein
MLKLFREIRRDLLIEGHLKKYLLYAFGEILLVMIGIILALQVGNWSEKRKDKSNETKYLLGIKSDLSYDLKQIVELQSDLQYKFNLIKTIDPSFYLSRGMEVQNLSLDTVGTWFLYRRPNAFRHLLGTYQTLVTNGDIKIISNESLLLDITHIYENHFASMQSIYESIKERESVFGWKYAYELKNFSLKELFFSERPKGQLIADTSFYYEQIRLQYQALDKLGIAIEAAIIEIEKELDS